MLDVLMEHPVGLTGTFARPASLPSPVGTESNPTQHRNPKFVKDHKIWGASVAQLFGRLPLVQVVIPSLGIEALVGLPLFSGDLLLPLPP